MGETIQTRKGMKKTKKKCKNLGQGDLESWEKLEIEEKERKEKGIRMKAEERQMDTGERVLELFSVPKS